MMTVVKVYQVLNSQKTPHTSPSQASYRKTSSINGNKSQNLNVFHLFMQLSLPNPLEPGAKSRVKM